jgi:hypothetical protein
MIETIILICFGLLLLLVVDVIATPNRNKKHILSVTSLDRGTSSERALILKLIKNGVPSKAIFHDLMLKREDNELSQIDLVIATKQGIIVMEVKDYKGWIYGSGNNNYWTQVLSYGKKKHRFYNPIKQNKNHIKYLKTKLKQFDNIPFYSIIVFYGDCTLKEIDYVPKGTYVAKPKRIIELLNQIQNNNFPAPYTDKKEIVDLFKEAVIVGGDEEAQKRHINNINNNLGKHRVYD